MKKILLLLSVFCLLGCSEEEQKTTSVNPSEKKDYLVIDKQNIAVPAPKGLTTHLNWGRCMSFMSPYKKTLLNPATG